MQQRHEKRHNSSLLCTIYDETICIHIIINYIYNLHYATCNNYNLTICTW